MPHVPVYRFETFDTAAKRFRTQPTYGTRSAIDSVRGLAMLETRQEVPASEVDAAGWYVGRELLPDSALVKAGGI